MQCQLCNNADGPFEFADVYDNGRAKVMLICEDCANRIRKLSKKQEKLNKKNRERWQNRLPIREV